MAVNTLPIFFITKSCLHITWTACETWKVLTHNSKWYHNLKECSELGQYRQWSVNLFRGLRPRHQYTTTKPKDTYLISFSVFFNLFSASLNCCLASSAAEVIQTRCKYLNQNLMFFIFLKKRHALYHPFLQINIAQIWNISAKVRNHQSNHML